MKRVYLLLFFLLAGIGVALAQSKMVKGVVLGEGDRQPVIGASVVVVGHSTVGAATDLSGRFSFKVPADAKSIKVSFIGYKDKVVTITPETMRIYLSEDTQVLDDVVVIGYGSGKKIANVSASLVKVTAKEIEEKPTANVMDALQGKVAGLSVLTSSGEPSAISSMTLHGVGSLTAGTAPLYILDGMPVTSGTILGLNPNDYESVQVLKDAAATSIYGARAANGVIYITTKKGKSGERAKITVRGQYGVSNIANTDYFEKFMSTKELLDFSEEVGSLAPAQIQQYREKYGNVNTEWWKYYLKQNVPTYQSDISIAGGLSGTRYYISSSLFSQEGLRVGSDYNRYNMRVNLDSKLNKYMSITMNNTISYDIVNESPFDRNSTNAALGFLASPWWTPYKPDGTPYYSERIPGWNRFNPQYLTDLQPNPATTFNWNGLGSIKVTPLKGLVLRSQAAMEFSDSRVSYIRSPKFPFAVGNGRNSQSFSRVVTFSTNSTAEYKFDICKNNHFNLLAGHEYIANRRTSFSAEGNGLTDDRLTLLSSVTKDKTVGQSFTEYAFLSFFGQFSYDYANKYFIDLVLRNDATSRFAKQARSGIFWSVGTMWKLKNESFLQDVKWLNELDFKFSIGTQGNASVGGNYLPYATVVKSGQYKGKAGWAISNPGNPLLTWETQRTTTVGVNTRFLDNIFGLSVEYYHRLTLGMLLDVPKAYTTGVEQVTENIGTYLNQGLDVKFDVNILRGKDYGLSAYANINYNRDKILKIFGGRKTYIIPNTGFGYVVGEPVNFLYALQKGVDPKTGQMEWYLPGDDIGITRKDDKATTTTYSEALAQNTGVRRYTPFVGGFGLHGDYKGLYLDANFSFALGKHLISNDQFFFNNPYTFSGFNQIRDVKNYWKKPGDRTKYASLDFIKSTDRTFQNFDSSLLEDASFLRLKTLTLGYNIPTRLLSKQDFIKGAKVYLTGRNVLTFTKFNGPDPEIDSNLTLGAYPNSKQYSVGVELTF